MNSTNSKNINTNIFEIIQFGLQRNLSDGRCIDGIYGVNVAKVREVIRMPKINPLASRIEGIEGIFELRNIPIPAINLCTVLGDNKKPLNDDQQIIVVEVAGKRAGFIVDATHRIRRMAWSNVLPPSSDDASCMTGMVLIENNEFLFILDLERILSILEMSAHNTALSSVPQSFANDDRPFPQSIKFNGFTVLLADDSSFMLNNISAELKKSGFNVILAENGAKALDILNQQNDREIDIIVTDIEMPQLDGLSLTSKIKSDKKLASIPVLLHSSLSGDAMKASGASVGANGYVVKGDINSLINSIYDLVELKKSA